MINFIRNLFSKGKPADAPYQIVQCETREVEEEGETKNAIFLAADLFDESHQQALADEMVSLFVNQRMCSPEDTSMLLITVVGLKNPDSLASMWKANCEKDQVAQLWMSKMEKADLGSFTDSGEPTFASLI